MIVLSGFLAASLYAQEQSSAKPSLPIANAPAIPLTLLWSSGMSRMESLSCRKPVRSERVKLAVHPVFIDRDGRLLNPALASIKPERKCSFTLCPIDLSRSSTESLLNKSRLEQRQAKVSPFLCSINPSRKGPFKL